MILQGCKARLDRSKASAQLKTVKVESTPGPETASQKLFDMYRAGSLPDFV